MNVLLVVIVFYMKKTKFWYKLLEVYILYSELTGVHAVLSVTHISVSSEQRLRAQLFCGRRFASAQLVVI